MLKRSGLSRVLVLGLGFIGTHLARRLRQAGHEVVVVSRSPPSPAFLAEVEPCRVFIGEAVDAVAVDTLMAGVQATVHCCRGLLPAESVAQPQVDHDLTVLPLATVLRRLRRYPGMRFVYLSSGGTVYGCPSYLPVDEGHPLRPIVPYGTNRVAAERLIASEAVRHGLAATVLRPSNVYGPGQPARRGQGVIAAFLDASRRNVACVVYGDGSIVRDYVHVDDLGDVVARLVESRDVPSPLNVGSGQAVSLLELADTIRNVTGRALMLAHQPERHYDVKEIVLDVSRLRGVMRFEPIMIEEGIRRTWSAESGACLKKAAAL
ncbi:MAG TPA: NAD-dependent epimerase/dehydratase family protein [Thermoanaerobaculia bacterium]|jgi:UDP-glucose 4-epimerase|nr:NAD-dependent epimerase/dehydratase family protein [Thermoanaerobaculia bacterium]